MVENDNADSSEERNADGEVRSLRPIKGASARPAWAAPAADETASAPSSADHELEPVSEPTPDASAPAWVQAAPPLPPEPPAEQTSGGGGDGDGSSRKTAIAIGAMSVVLVGIVGALVVFIGGGGEDEQVQPLAETVAEMSPDQDEQAALSEPSPATDPASACKETTSADLVTGDGRGDRDSGPGVILAFEHAYYVERDAKKMIALTSQDSRIRNAEALQEGIDSNPESMTHCVRVAATEDDAVWLVEITQTTEDAEPETITQRITTTEEDGQWSVVKIEEAS